MKNHLLDQIIPDTEAVDKVADAAEVTDPLAALIALLQQTPPNTVALTQEQLDGIADRCTKKIVTFLEDPEVQRRLIHDLPLFGED
jgi:hypothetical protein